MSTVAEPPDLTTTLRGRRHPTSANKHPVNQAHHEKRTTGEVLADRLSNGMGSWTFLIVQTIFMIVWISANGFWLAHRAWDPFPFILLNLTLSLQATYAGPIVLLAGNRQAAKDRLTLEHAADEAEKGGDAVNRILVEIRKNTTMTLSILEELEAKA